MKKRHTIVMDEEIEVKLRKLQAELIAKTGRSVSFSAVINQMLKKALH